MIDCTFENGKKANLRHVTVGVLALNDKNELLLVRRSSNIINGGKLTVPGGFLDRKENTKQGALRELKEETGYEGEIVSLFQVNDNPDRPKEDRQNVDFIYVVSLTDKGDLEPGETEDLEWYSRKSLPDEDEFAFDHRNIIVSYFDYLDKKFDLPIIGPV